jgi:regulator of sirC expression with transglutaminase-like and TPR domain
VDVTTRFAELVRLPPPQVPLDETALLIAAHAHEGLDVAAQLRALDEIAAGCRSADLDGLRRHLFGELGFRGDTDDYYNPRNSLLDDVLLRRRGIPITLSVVLIETGRRLGVDLVGVGMPGHFLTRLADDPDTFVDAFHGGEVLGPDGCRLRHQLAQAPAPFRLEYLAPVDTPSIVSRMLANLEAIGAAGADRALLEWVLRLRCLLPDAGPAEHGRLASVLASSGRYVQAAEIFERLAAEAPPGPRAERAAATAHRLRAKLN